MAGSRVSAEARTKPNCGGSPRAASAATRSGALTVKEKSSSTSTQAPVRVPASRAKASPSAVTRAGPQAARTVRPSGKNSPCSISRDSPRGSRTAAAAASTRRPTPARTASSAAARATARDSGQAPAAVVITAVQPAAVSDVSGWRVEGILMGCRPQARLARWLSGAPLPASTRNRRTNGNWKVVRRGRA